MRLKLEDKNCFYAVENDVPALDDEELLADYNAQNNKARCQIAKFLRTP